MPHLRHPKSGRSAPRGLLRRSVFRCCDPALPRQGAFFGMAKVRAPPPCCWTLQRWAGPIGCLCGAKGSAVWILYHTCEGTTPVIRVHAWQRSETCFCDNAVYMCVWGSGVYVFLAVREKGDAYRSLSRTAFLVSCIRLDSVRDRGKYHHRDRCNRVSVYVDPAKPCIDLSWVSGGRSRGRTR